MERQRQSIIIIATWLQFLSWLNTIFGIWYLKLSSTDTPTMFACKNTWFKEYFLKGSWQKWDGARRIVNHSHPHRFVLHQIELKVSRQHYFILHRWIPIEFKASRLFSCSRSRPRMNLGWQNSEFGERIILTMGSVCIQWLSAGRGGIRTWLLEVEVDETGDWRKERGSRFGHSSNPVNRGSTCKRVARMREN